MILLAPWLIEYMDTIKSTPICFDIGAVYILGMVALLIATQDAYTPDRYK